MRKRSSPQRRRASTPPLFPRHSTRPSEWCTAPNSSPIRATVRKRCARASSRGFVSTMQRLSSESGADHASVPRVPQIVRRRASAVPSRCRARAKNSAAQSIVSRGCARPRVWAWLCNQLGHRGIIAAHVAPSHRVPIDNSMQDRLRRSTTRARQGRPHADISTFRR